MSKFFNKHFAMKQKFTNLYGAICDVPSVCKASSAVCMVREKISEAKIFGMKVAFKWKHMVLE